VGSTFYFKTPKKEINLFLEKGAHSVLKKPVDPDDLSKFVHKLESEI